MSENQVHLCAVTKKKQVEVEKIRQRLNLTTVEFRKIPDICSDHY